jgi:hypothetical protein
MEDASQIVVKGEPPPVGIADALAVVWGKVEVQEFKTARPWAHHLGRAHGQKKSYARKGRAKLGDPIRRAPRFPIPNTLSRTAHGTRQGGYLRFEAVYAERPARFDLEAAQKSAGFLVASFGEPSRVRVQARSDGTFYVHWRCARRGIK